VHASLHTTVEKVETLEAEKALILKEKQALMDTIKTERPNQYQVGSITFCFCF
jgi:uncharacterized protein (UPF0335 family)